MSGEIPDISKLLADLLGDLDNLDERIEKSDVVLAEHYEKLQEETEQLEEKDKLKRKKLLELEDEKRRKLNKDSKANKSKSKSTEGHVTATDLEDTGLIEALEALNEKIDKFYSNLDHTAGASISTDTEKHQNLIERVKDRTESMQKRLGKLDANLEKRLSGKVKTTQNALTSFSNTLATLHKQQVSPGLEN